MVAPRIRGARDGFRECCRKPLITLSGSHRCTHPSNTRRRTCRPCPMTSPKDTPGDSTPCDKMPKDHPPFQLQSTRTRDPRGRDAPTCMHATTVLCAPPRQIRDRRVRGRCTCPGGRRAATNVRPRRGSPRNLMRGGRLPVQRPPAHPPQPPSWYPPPWP